MKIFVSTKLTIPPLKTKNRKIFLKIKNKERKRCIVQNAIFMNYSGDTNVEMCLARQSQNSLLALERLQSRSKL